MKSLALNTLSLDSAPAESRPVLEAVKAKLGFIPNLFATFANNPEVLKGYLALSDGFAKSGLSPAEQQIVAITASRENQCHYCVAVHSALSAMSKLDAKLINDLREGNSLTIPKHEALRVFTKRIVSARGWLDESDVKSFKDAGYGDADVAAVVLRVTMKTLSNYINHISGTTLDPQFSDFKV